MGCPAEKRFQQTNGQQHSSPVEFVFRLLEWSVETLGDEAAKQGLSDGSAPSVLEAYWGWWPVQDHDE